MGALGFAIVMGLLSVVPPAAAASDLPSAGQYFDYQENVALSNGQGNYSGYSESMTAHAHYLVASASANSVTMAASGSFTWQNSTGSSNSSSWNLTFAFSPVTRLYTRGFDVSGNYSDPSIWFWIPTPASLGATIRILDENLTVVSTDATVWLGIIPPVPVTGTLLRTSGNYTRDDIYGIFNASYTDEYWFDPSTGFVLAELYQEHDQSANGSFDWKEQVYVTAASFPLPYDWFQLLGVYAGIPALVVLGAYGLHRHYRGPRHVRVGAGAARHRVTIRRIRRLTQIRASDAASFSPYAPFLLPWARRALAVKYPVLVATAAGQVVGQSIYDTETRVASVFAADARVAETLLRMKKSDGFFASVADPAWKPKAGPLQIFKILSLENPRPAPFDPARVRPMQPTDLSAVIALAEATYRGPARRWLTECLQDGDLGFVAEWKGSLAGFAFATVAGDQAMFHTLTVAPRFQGEGLGTELLAVRLTAVAALGIRVASLDIAEENDAALHLARKAGFADSGSIGYYVRRPKRAPAEAGAVFQ